MKPYTLDDHIKEQYIKSKTFAKHYDRELLINSIARLESGKDTRIPSLGLLLRIAAASGEKLNISFSKRS